MKASQSNIQEKEGNSAKIEMMGWKDHETKWGRAHSCDAPTVLVESIGSTSVELLSLLSPFLPEIHQENLVAIDHN